MPPDPTPLPPKDDPASSAVSHTILGLIGVLTTLTPLLLAFSSWLGTLDDTRFIAVAGLLGLLAAVGILAYAWIKVHAVKGSAAVAVAQAAPVQQIQITPTPEVRP